MLATVCNTTPNAVPFSLWLARSDGEYLIDLSGVLGRPGDGGLTGLARHGDRIYVAVQSSDTPRILILDPHLSPVGVITSPKFADIHSIHVAGNALLVCSTGAQSVIRVDLTDQHTTTLCSFEAPVHLNSACFGGSELLVCCHYPDRVVPEAVGGGIITANGRRVVLVGLGQPHSLEPDNNGFLVLDSDGHRVIRFDHSGVRQQRTVDGFLRGIAASGGSIFIASSAGRVISRKNPAVRDVSHFWNTMAEKVCIYELDETTLQAKAEHFPVVAGFEIYALLAVEGGHVMEIASERLIPANIQSMSRVYYEAAKRALAEMHQRR